MSTGPTTPPDATDGDAERPRGRALRPHRWSLQTRMIVAVVSLVALILIAIGFATGAILRWLVGVFWSVDITPGGPDVWWWVAGLAIWAFLYLWVGLGIAGRTPGKGLAGLRVVNKAGDPLTSGRAAFRVLVYPLSFVLLGVGLLGALFGRHRRCLHDVIAGTCVIYDWGGRTAELEVWIRRADGRLVTVGWASAMLPSDS